MQGVRFSRSSLARAVRGRSPRVNRKVRHFFTLYGHPGRYLRENPDVAALGVDPVLHWYRSGLREGRRFPGIRPLPIEHNRSAHPSPTEASGPGVTLTANDGKRYELVVDAEFADELLFEAFVQLHGDADAYLASNKDVADAGIPPRQHWLDSGMAEGRVMPGIDVALRLQGPSGDWQLLSWRGKPVHVRPHVPFPPDLHAEIVRQSEHEIALLAPGRSAMVSLPRFDAIDLFARDGIDMTAVLRQVGTRRRHVLVLRSLVVGGAEKYAADLLHVLTEQGCNDVLVLVTDQSEAEARAVADFSILRPLIDAEILHLTDHLREGVKPDATLVARLLHAIAPESAIIINSEVALKAVRQYGRALSANIQVVCAFFSLAPGTPGSRFAQSVASFATVLTDNQRTADEVRRRFPYVAQVDPVVIPPRSGLSDATMDTFLRRRLERRSDGRSGAPRRWLWISRIERQKGTEILAHVARMRPTDQFSVLGPVEQEESLASLQLPNVQIGSVVVDIDHARPEEYDGFLFTSLEEGMPNVVLEMAARAVPIITTDVGGLRETFDDRSLAFINIYGDEERTAHQFVTEMERIDRLSTEGLGTGLRLAQRQLATRHAGDVFSDLVSRLLIRAHV